MDFYKRLNYSLCNEDWNVEKQALRIQPGDRVLCVTASGDRPLHLLMTDCREVISLDMNQIQNYLLDLKIGAITTLDYEKYIAFLGYKNTPHRYAIFKELKSVLTPEAADHWEKNKKMIDRGILYQGFLERSTYLISCLATSFSAKKIHRLFNFTDITHQRDFVAREWDTYFFRKIFDFFLNKKILRLFINDPGLFSYVDASIHPGNYIYKRMLKYLSQHLANKSILLQLVFLGKILPEAIIPYLTYEGYSKIKKNVDRLQFKTENIIEYMHRENTPKIDAFSLSDIASYMPQTAFENLLKGVIAASNSGARFCLREFLSKRYIPEKLKSYLIREPLLEKKLEDEECNFVYRFMVGEIKI